MSRKHNTKHVRSASHYPERLAARGLSRAPEMPTLEVLRKKAERRAAGIVEPEGESPDGELASGIEGA